VLGLRDLYLEIVNWYVVELRRFLGARLRSVCLFGSVARGDFTRESDIDVLVVAENLQEDIGMRYRTLGKLGLGVRATGWAEQLRCLGYSTNISPVYLTPEEADRHPPVLLDIVEDGVIVFDENGFLAGVLSQIRERLRELGARRVRTAKGWYWVLKPDAELGEEIRI